MNAMEKVAYIKGLMEGLGIDDSSKEGKVLKVMAEVLEELASSVSDVESELSEIFDHVDSIDEDLGLLEDDYYGYDDDDDDDDDDCCCCDNDEDDEELYEVVCPKCGDSICINDSIIETGSIDCPNCGEKLEFDIDDECDCEGCSHKED